MKIGFISLGCAKNTIDSEVMLALLKEENYELTTEPEEADVIVINTCTFIKAATEESLDTISEMVKYKKNGASIIVTGCLSERYREKIMADIEGVDALLGTNNYPEIVRIIKEVRDNKKVTFFDNDKVYDDNFSRIKITDFYAAYLKIADGCDNKCTYCIIPKVRGRYKSRKIENILAEAERLARNGTKEIIIIAQDTTKYGRDLYYNSYMLPALLRGLCKIDGIEWIRLHYCYPEDITEELISVIAEEEKICNYIDIPFQHCNSKILRKMGRAESDIGGLIEMIRQKIPDIVIRTSIIVGFPGETEEIFDELKEFIRLHRFDRMGIFKYSKEEGTPAARFKNQIEEDVKERRLNELAELQQYICISKNKEKINQVLKVLIEGEDNKYFYGRSYGDSIDVDGKVYILKKRRFERLEVGTFVHVKIKAVKDIYDLLGERYEYSK